MGISRAVDECSKITTVIGNYSLAPHGLERSGITYQSINNNMYALHNGRRRLRQKGGSNQKHMGGRGSRFHFSKDRDNPKLWLRDT